MHSAAQPPLERKSFIREEDGARGRARCVPIWERAVSVYEQPTQPRSGIYLTPLAGFHEPCSLRT